VFSEAHPEKNVTAESTDVVATFHPDIDFVVECRFKALDEKFKPWMVHIRLSQEGAVHNECFAKFTHEEDGVYNFRGQIRAPKEPGIYVAEARYILRRVQHLVSRVKFEVVKPDSHSQDGI
jgi:hypothetical protein